MDVGKIIGKFLGNKADRDMREVMPYVDLIQQAYEPIPKLSNDQLREHSAALKQRVSDYVSAEKKEMEELKAKAEDPEVDVNEKEPLYAEIDKLEEVIDEKYEEVLNEILPEAFAIIKDTARRLRNMKRLRLLHRIMTRLWQPQGTL